MLNLQSAEEAEAQIDGLTFLDASEQAAPSGWAARSGTDLLNTAEFCTSRAASTRRDGADLRRRRGQLACRGVPRRDGDARPVENGELRHHFERQDERVQALGRST